MHCFSSSFLSSAVAEPSPPPSLQQGSSQSKPLCSLGRCPSSISGLLDHPAGIPSSSPTPKTQVLNVIISGFRMSTFRRFRLASRPPLVPEKSSGNLQPIAHRGQGVAAIGTGAPVLENAQQGAGRDREAGTQAPGSAVTLVSAKQKPARKGLWLHGGSRRPHASKGHRLINLFNHKLRVKPYGSGFTYDPQHCQPLLGN